VRIVDLPRRITAEATVIGHRFSVPLAPGPAIELLPIELGRVANQPSGRQPVR
jgi:hypothetical protein